MLTGQGQRRCWHGRPGSSSALAWALSSALVSASAFISVHYFPNHLMDF